MSYLSHLDNLFSTESLIFRRSDINMTALMCNAAGLCEPFHAGSKRGPTIKNLTILSNPNISLKKKWTEETDNLKKREKVCTIKMVADHTFFQKATDRTIAMTINEMLTLITMADIIFRKTDFDNDGEPDGIGFQISSVVVWKSINDANYELYGNNLSPEDLLNAFSLYDASDVCVAVCLVHRPFPGNVLGLAYTASAEPRHAGGICQRRVSSNPPRSYNVAVITVEGSTGRLPRAISGRTLSHELGHSFGSEHDPKSDYCSPSYSRGGAYLMADTIENSNFENNDRFSPCSLYSIARVLPVKGHCLLAQHDIGDNVCGNAIREKGEECDCGLSSQCRETDVCCVPKGGSGSEVECTLTKNAECSPRNGPCCKTDCTLISASVKMVCSETDCTETMICTGLSAECPPSKPKPDGTPCNDNNGVCQSAKCIDKTCAKNGMEDCLCNGWKYGCEICCITKGLCIPISHLGILNVQGAKTVKRDGEKCNRELGICENGLCKPYESMFDEINEELQIKSKQKRSLEDTYNMMTIIIAVILFIVLVTICLMLVYFFTPLGSLKHK